MMKGGGRERGLVNPRILQTNVSSSKQHPSSLSPADPNNTRRRHFSPVLSFTFVYASLFASDDP